MKKLLLFVLLIVSSSIIYAQSDTYKKGSRCFIVSQDYVKSKMNYPKSVKFNRNYVHETDGYGDAVVLAKFSAKNSFGMEKDYVYKIWLNHNGGEWTEMKNWKMKKLIIEDTSTKEQSVYTK